MPRLLCFMPAPQQNTPPHNKTPNLQRPQPTSKSQHKRVTAESTAMALYACLRHALFGVAMKPTAVDALLSRGLPVNVCLRHTPILFYFVLTGCGEGSHTIGLLQLYAYLRHALSGCHETPRPSLPLLSRGLPVNVYLRHTPFLPPYILVSLLW